MKALEILKEGLGFMEKAIKTNPLSKEELESEIKVYQEAIGELEVIQERVLQLEIIETNVMA